MVDLATTEVTWAVRRLGPAMVLITTLAACSTNLPGASSWTRKHDLYPNISGEYAAVACRNQSDTAFRGATGGKAEALYFACMEAFGFAQRPVEDTTVSSAR